MSDYSQITFFTPKDGLATGNPNKIIYGSDVDAELSAISTAIATKADVDGDAIGAGTPATELSVDNLKLDANKIISTNTDGDIELEPNGAGYVVITNADINAGNIDNTVIGATTAAAITGTTLTANTSLALASGATVTAILDEDNLVSDSATALATQQSIKAYVDAQVTAQDLDVTTDSGTIAIDLDSETLTVAGGTGLDTSATGNTVTVAIDSTVATLTGAQTLTNKVLTSPDINTPDIDGGTIDGATIATSDITVGAGKTLDVSAGTLTLANDQISGDKIQGGTIGSVTITTADINGGSLDGTIIGAATPAAGSFTTFTSTGIDDNATSTAITIDASENVGIGTISPSGALHVLRSGLEAGITLERTTSATAKFTIAANDGNLVFTDQNQSAERMRIDSSGQVGIGTGSPNATLKVQGPVDTATLSTSSTPAARINNGGAISNWIGANGYNYGYIQSIQDDGTNNLKPLALQPLGGNVGIGTSSPATKLEVQRSGAGNVASFNDGTYGADIAATSTGGVLQTYNINQTLDFKVFNSGYMRFFEGSTERMRIDSSGNVGIGETSPLGKLHIKGSDTGATAAAQGNSLVLEDSENGLSILSSTAGAGYINFGDSDDNNIGMIVYGHSSNSMNFWTNASERMRIDSSGNLLVGVSSVQDFTATTTNGHTLYGGSVNAALHSRSGNAALAVQRTTNDGAIVNFFKDTTAVGSIGTNTGNIYLTDGARSLIVDGSVVKAGYSTGGDADNAQDLGSSAVRFKDLYLSGGVYLGGTGAANLLDDYEEGTFTPAFGYSGGNGTGSWSYSAIEGNYTKIGRMVYFRVEVRFTGTFVKGSATGTPIISGLPFTAGGMTNGEHYDVSFRGYNYPLTTTDGEFPGPVVTAFGSQILLYNIRNNSSYGNMTDPDSNTDLKIAGWYTVP